MVRPGTHGKSGMEAFWEGSVARGVYSRRLQPLLLIPEGRPAGWPYPAAARILTKA